MTESPHTFLRLLSPELARQYDLAYRYAHEDPESSLVKLRACAVLMLKVIFSHHGLEIRPALFDSLNIQGIHRYLPYHVQEKLNFLRVEGNKGAHPGGGFRSRNVARKTALQALRAAHQVAAWIGETLKQLPPAQIPEFHPPDQAISERLYGDAIVRDNPDAQYSVATWFQQRWRATEDPEESKNLRRDLEYWLEKAARHQHPAALYQWGELLLTAGSDAELERAESLLRRAADLDNVDALYRLGCGLLEGHLAGRRSCPVDYAGAFQCFSRAAENDHLGALNQLVRMYYEGLGVETDHDQAFEYAYRAAQAGYPSAQFKLAHLYQSGCGVDPSLAEAFHWYQEAARAGYADAQVVLFKFYSNGLYVAKDMQRAIEWLLLAEAQDHPGACYYLGLACQRGIGLPVDPERALNLFKRCMELDRGDQYRQRAATEFIQGIRQLRERSRRAASARARRDSPQEKKVGRNDPCPCGSGKKYKKCCLYAES